MATVTDRTYFPPLEECLSGKKIILYAHSSSVLRLMRTYMQGTDILTVPASL